MQGYLITNLVTGKRYVGKTTKTIEKRWIDHKTGAKRGGRTPLQRALRKYSSENFIIDPLNPCEFDITTEAELNDWERLMIRLIGTRAPNGYSLTDGGEGISGLRHSEETKRRLSEKTKGQWASGIFDKRCRDRASKKLPCFRSPNGGKIQGKTNVESGHWTSIQSMGPCTRWNINRNKPCVCGQHQMGYPGVKKRKPKYRARIWANGKRCSLGCFMTPEEALKAVLAARM